jgi:glycosyltransferase involved in cell wall biosynthesis
MTYPLVSVIIPAYRASSFLPSAIASMRQQCVPAEVEIIIVDDGSGDDTGATALELAAEHPGTRAIVLEENGGVARARQRGVSEARGEYLWFVDADDAWTIDALRIMVALAQSLDADVVVAGAEFVYPSGATRPLPAPIGPPVTGREAFRMLLRGEITGHLWNKLFRRSVMAKASFAPARVHSDLIMVADALSHAGRVAFTAPVVYQYLLRSNSLITTTSQRAKSLDIVDEAVTESAKRLGLTGSDDYRYFRVRYIHLSGIKDAMNASYPPAERASLLSQRRRALSPRDFFVLLRRRDLRRLALGITAKTSLRAHRALLVLAER